MESVQIDSTVPGRDTNADRSSRSAAEDDLGRFVVMDGTASDPTALPAPIGIFDMTKGVQLTNFVIVVDEIIDTQIGSRNQTTYACTLIQDRCRVRFQIDAEAYASNSRLRATLYKVGGPGIQIECDLGLLRKALSCILLENPPRRVRVSSECGWDESGSVFLVPAGQITVAGFTTNAEGAPHRIDLSGTGLARNLDLCPLAPDLLRQAKQHVVEDLLHVHAQRVTYSLLGTLGVAILYRFCSGIGRFALWLNGRTGAGKSFAAKLFTNFFGDYQPSSDGQFATWNSTPSFLQQQGYRFKDALFPIDDYKPEVVDAKTVIAVIQGYADNMARGRLSGGGARLQEVQPIRGQLVCSGEQLPEWSSSSVARLIVVPVPDEGKDLARGQRCLSRCGTYSGVTAALIHHLLTNNRCSQFPEHVQSLQARFLDGIDGQPNGLRIATNFALLAAGFSEVVDFLADIWPEAASEKVQFIQRDLVAMRNDMLRGLRAQEPAYLFLMVLCDLINDGRVRVLGHGPDVGDRIVGQKRPHGIVRVSTHLALEAVQAELRRRGQNALLYSERGLLDELAKTNLLRDPQGNLLNANAERTQYVRIQGRPSHCFHLDEHDLVVGA